MANLHEWLTTAAHALDLDPGDLDEALVLDLARDGAHGVARPAAPLTAYLLGVAVGRGTAAAAAADKITAALQELGPPRPG